MTLSPSDFVPMRSVGQFPAGDNGGPLPYMWNIIGPLGALQGELHWHMFDLCRFHQIMYQDLRDQVQHLDERFAQFKRVLQEQEAKVEEDDLEAFRVAESRTLTAFFDKDSEVERVKHFADEFSVVGLWATAEQYLGKTYVEIEHLQSGTPREAIQRPYRWDDFEARFAAKSISLRGLNGFADADECRVLNNTIKHAGSVNDRLAAFAYFTSHSGVKLTQVDFEMQRYLNGVFNLLGSAIEAGNRRLDPSFPH